MTGNSLAVVRVSGMLVRAPNIIEDSNIAGVRCKALNGVRLIFRVVVIFGDIDTPPIVFVQYPEAATVIVYTPAGKVNE